DADHIVEPVHGLHPLLALGDAAKPPGRVAYPPERRIVADAVERFGHGFRIALPTGRTGAHAKRALGIFQFLHLAGRGRDRLPGRTDSRYLTLDSVRLPTAAGLPRVVLPLELGELVAEVKGRNLGRAVVEHGIGVERVKLRRFDHRADELLARAILARLKLRLRIERQGVEVGGRGFVQSRRFPAW